MSTLLKNSHSASAQKSQTHIYQYLWFQLLLGLIVLLSAGIVFLKIRFSPDKCVNKFLSALDTNDYQTIKDFITCDDVTITEESLKPFIDLYHADKQFGSDIKNTLNQDLANVDLDTYNDKHWIKLVPHHKFLVKTYTILIQPVTVTLNSNLNPVSVSYANQSQILEQPEESLPAILLPGLYQFDANYTDHATDKVYTINHGAKILSDVSLNLDFDCSSLVLDVPKNYTVDSIAIGGINLMNLFTEKDGTLQYYPVFQDEIITLTCNNTWAQTVSTAFTIPKEYVNQTYRYECDFNHTSKEFIYGSGLTLTKLSINGKEITNTSDYIDSDKNSFLLSDLIDHTIVETTLTAPWGETFTDSYEVTKDNFDEYYHEIRCYLSDETKNQILQYAATYYKSLFEALNHDQFDKLDQYSDIDEVAYDFYIMLENIQYDYENHTSDSVPFEEDITLEPVELYADLKQLETYSDPFILNLISFVNTTTTSMDEVDNSPKVQLGSEDYNMMMHISYNTKLATWQVTANFYDYENYTLVDPIQLDLQ